MKIIIQDNKTGKKYLLKSNGMDWEIFKESKGKMVDGVKKGEGGWTSTRYYPNELQYAVGKVLQWLFKNPDDPDVICVESKTAVKELRKVINERAKQITASIVEGDKDHD